MDVVPKFFDSKPLEVCWVITENALIKTKLRVPDVGQNIITRKRLDATLRSSDRYKLTLISAPAGYGKTTAAASYLLKAGSRTVWYSLGPEDNDPVLFWRRLLRGLADAFPDSGFQELDPSFELISSNVLAGLAIDRLSSLQDTAVIVLDDFQLTGHELIRKSVRYLAGYLPDHMHLMVLSRRDLDEEFAVMLSKGQALRIGSGELALDLGETSRFFQKRGIRLTTSELADIQRITEGWAAGLVLSTLPSGAGAPAGLGSGATVGRLFGDEVFDKWGEDVKRFLVGTAFLRQLSGSLCAAVTGNGESPAILERLASWNSFVVRQDGKGEWFRYHHLFAAFLQDKLREKEPESICALYRNAGRWYEANGYLHESVDAFLDAGDYRKAESLFWTIYPSYASRGEFSTLLGWMERLPEARHRFNALYCFIRGWLLNMEERPDEAVLWNDRAMDAFQARNFELYEFPSEYALMKTLILCQADIAIRRMDVPGILACYAKATEYDDLPPVFHGEVNACQPSLLKTPNGLYGRLRQLQDAYIARGVYATDVYHNVPVFTLVGHIEMLYEVDMLEDCAALIDSNVAKVLDAGLAGAIVPYFFTLVKLNRSRGDMSGALEALFDCRTRLSGKKAIWSYLADLVEAELAMNIGDIKKAESLLALGRLGIYDELSNSREFEYVTYARYLIKTGRPDKAVLLLNRLDDFAERGMRLSSRIEILSLLSAAHGQAGKTYEALRCLEAALALGQQHGYIRTYLDQGPVVAQLLSQLAALPESDSPGRQYADMVLWHIQSAPGNMSDSGDSVAALSKQEKRILVLLEEGCSNSDIAARLSISENTVKYHNTNIFSKLDGKNRLDAVKKAREQGLL